MCQSDVVFSTQQNYVSTLLSIRGYYLRLVYPFCFYKIYIFNLLIPKIMQALDEQQVRDIEGGVVEGGCIPPIFDGFPFPVY